MMAFCGHEDFCKSFNSQLVLQRAKENVDRDFPVVGVLEDLNKTLSVLENRMPHIFKGAFKVCSLSVSVVIKKLTMTIYQN
jgi:hypothetical protein